MFCIICIACLYLVIDLVHTTLRHRHHFSAFDLVKSNLETRTGFPSLVGSDNITLNRKSLIRITDSRRCLEKKCNGWKINKQYRQEARERIDCKMPYELSLSLSCAYLCIPYATLQTLITCRPYIHYVTGKRHIYLPRQPFRHVRGNAVVTLISLCNTRWALQRGAVSMK